MATEQSCLNLKSLGQYRNPHNLGQPSFGEYGLRRKKPIETGDRAPESDKEEPGVGFAFAFMILVVFDGDKI